jgi:hypothetical protein
MTMIETVTDYDTLEIYPDMVDWQRRLHSL